MNPILDQILVWLAVCSAAGFFLLRRRRKMKSEDCCGSGCAVKSSRNKLHS